MAFVGPFRQIHDHWSWTKSGKVQMLQCVISGTYAIFSIECVVRFLSPLASWQLGNLILNVPWCFNNDIFSVIATVLGSDWFLVRWNAAEPIYWFVCEVFFEFARFPKLLQFSRLKSLILGDIDSNVMFQTRIVSSSSSSLLIIIIKIIIAIIICGCWHEDRFPKSRPRQNIVFPFNN